MSQPGIWKQEPANRLKGLAVTVYTRTFPLPPGKKLNFIAMKYIK